MLRIPRWSEIPGRPRWLWGRVESTSPLQISHAGSIIGSAVYDDSLVPDLAPGDRVRYEHLGRAITVLGRASRNWRYDIATVNPGWVTIAHFPGSGRASGTFRVLNEDSGDHDMLLFDFQVAYSQASITLRNYTTFGRASQGINGIRYLRNAADPTYGPGILQINVSETLTGWSVLCEQPSDSRLTAMTPGTFSTSVSGYDTTAPFQTGVGVSEWIAATLENGWVNLAGGYSPLRYQMLPGGATLLSGNVVGTNATGTVITTLPPGYRPQERLINVVMASSGGNIAGRVDILVDGRVMYNATPMPGFVGVNNLVFQSYQ